MKKVLKVKRGRRVKRDKKEIKVIKVKKDRRVRKEIKVRRVKITQPRVKKVNQ